MRKRFDIGKFWKGRKQPLSVRRKRGESLKGREPWNAGRKLSELHKERLRISNIQAYGNKSLRMRMSRIKKKQYVKTDLEKKIDRTVTKYYREHPLMRRKQAQKAMDYFKRNPRAFHRFLEAGKNPLRKHIKTKPGFLVRSKGEKRIADFLFDNGIKAEYECKTFFLGGYFCTPDFYLVKKKVYIEFYGGYPGSWKKKVIKNRLYPKFGIPVVSITPSELDDLRFLLKFG